MNLGGYTSAGPRSTNEDSYFFLDFSDVNSFDNGAVAFVMVSDGMGGYQGGDIASGIAVTCARSYLTQLLDMARGNKVELDANAALAEISRNAHEAILAESSKRNNAGMGATFVGAFLSPTHAWIGHVGDSRAYLVRDGEATRLTEDHSQVGWMLSHGIITEEEAQNHPARNRIERALGFSDGEPEIDEIDLQPGDALLLCSDGVYTVVDSSSLGGFVAKATDATTAARSAVKAALSRGTDDNSTAVVALTEQASSTATLVGVLDARATKADKVTGRRSEHPREGVSDATQKRRSSGGGLSLPTVLPFVVIALLAGALAFFVTKTMPETSPVVPDEGQQSTTTQSEVQEPTGEAVETEVQVQPVPDGQDDTEESPDAQAPDMDAPETPEDVQVPDVETTPEQHPMASTPAARVGYATYVLNDHIQLQYIDSNGVAKTFTDENLVLGSEVPYLVQGTRVVVTTESNLFGGEKAYQVLDVSYRDDLLHDVALYRDGVSTFSSALSQIIDAGYYQNLVAQLSNYKQEYLEHEIADLAVETFEEGQAEVE